MGVSDDKHGGQGPSALHRAEELVFPVAAAAIGVGYTAAILVNNPWEKVAASPHAWILIAIFTGIAFFPLRSMALHLLKGASAGTPQ
ncbi:MAG: hypothetical protein HZA03_06170 [Nitrospinae bacterium]|nr:hypothetical protein [Nitrospinota bacterium]